MLEIESVRRDWGFTKGVRWYILYRTKPGMWEDMMVEAPTTKEAVEALTTMLKEWKIID